MVSVPGFLLRRLYVKGSLRATDEGLSFELKNSLGAGFAKRMLPLTVDGEEVAMKTPTSRWTGRRWPFSR
jgi:hypothetical protein